MKKSVLILMCFMMALGYTYSQSINYLSTTNGALIPTALPAINYYGPNPFGVYGACGEPNWRWIYALCSEPPTINSPDSSIKSSNHNGSAWYGGFGTQYMVVDLGQVRTFDELRVFQMMASDGKVSHAAMYIYPDTTEVVAPLFSNGSWSSVVAESVVNDGVVSGTVVTSPTVFAFPMQKARFLKFEFRNDGRYGNAAFVEVRELKLFNTLLTGFNNNDKEADVSIYPNPTYTGNVTIRFPETNQDYTVEIHSVTGKLVKQVDRSQMSKELFLDLSDHPRGLYFIKIQKAGKTILVDKIIVASK